MAFDLGVLIHQMIIFYTIVGVGFIAYRIRFIRSEEISALAYLVTHVFIPLLLVTSIVNSVEPGTMGAVVPITAALAIGNLLMFGVGFVSGKILRLKNPTLGVHTAAVGLPNDGFIGAPLWLAIFPDRAGLAIVAASIVYSITQWTISYPLTAATGEKFQFQWKKLITPALISVAVSLLMLAVNLRPTNVVWETLTEIGNCTKYLAMLYVGGMLGQQGFKRILGRPVLFGMAFFKMLVGPLLVFFLLRMLHLLDGTYLAMVVLMMAMPAPVIVSIQASMNHSDEEYAVGSLVLSTLVSLGTVPAVMYIFGLF